MNVGSPKGRESYGDRVPVVVAGVTTCQSGDRESRTTGRRGTGDRTARNREVCVMQDAETVLDVLRERGRKGLPCDELYRQMFNKEPVPAGLRAHLLQPGGDDAGGLRGDRGRHVRGEDRRRSSRLMRARAVPVRPGPPGATSRRRTGSCGRSACRHGRISSSARWCASCWRRIYEPQFSDRSHGFRKGRGCHTALREIQRHLDRDRVVHRG